MLNNTQVDSDRVLYSTGYTSDVLQDALVYAEHANKNDLDLDDVQLAIQGRVNHSFTNPPPKEVCQ